MLYSSDITVTSDGNLMETDHQIPRLRRRHAPGAPPGQIVPARDAGQPVIDVIAYGSEEFIEKRNSDLNTIRKLQGHYPVIWIDVIEFGDAKLIADIGEVFGLHRLALEDVVNTHQRPKVEEYDDHLFLIARMLHPERHIDTEQIAFFLGKDFLITFQERPGDCFDPVRDRIRRAKGRVRRSGPDYLFYTLIDSIMDVYFPALERHGETLENLEDKVVEHPDSHDVCRLHDLKRDLLMLRRAIWPHREMVNHLIRDDHTLIAADTRPFLRDCYDHTIQLMDIVETYREIASGLLDVYISSVSAKLNEIMKVLTIIATVFMPLSFIASLYGMNFDRQASPWNMPELGWWFGYPFALILMLISAFGFIGYFFRKGWLSGRRSR